MAVPCGTMGTNWIPIAARSVIMDSPPQGVKARPWMSFQTFWNFLGELAEKPLPPKIDRSLMSTKSGTDQNNLTSTMQVFGLIDEEGRVQTELINFAIADAEGRKTMLSKWVQESYEAPLRVSAANGTHQDLINAFRDELGMTGADTQRKAITFFQHAAQEAGIDLSPHFRKTRKGQGAPGTPKKRTATRRKSKDEKDDPPPPPAPKGHTQTVTLKSGGTVTLTYDVDLFAVDDDDEAFVLGLVKKLRRYPSADDDSSGASPSQGDDG